MATRDRTDEVDHAIYRGETADAVASTKRFFIAHSSRQKDFALELRDALTNDAWVDLHEIEVGDILLQEIAEGIEAASDFVLLWTAEAAASKWVRYETHMAFIRYLEDAAINMRVVCLDETPVPLHFRPLLQARGLDGVRDIATVLLGAPPVTRALRAFVNRSAEIGALEELLYANGRGLMWFYGVAGVGKRALAREALRRLSADSSRTARIAVKGGTGFVELHLALCNAVNEPIPDGALTEREAKESCAAIIEAFCAGGGIWLFEEAQHWLEADATTGRVLAEVLRSLNVAGVGLAERGAIFTSTRRPSLHEPHASIAELRRVRGLAPDFAVALLGNLGAERPERELRTVAAQLDGHPLALEMGAGLLRDEAQVDWESHRATTARTMIAELSLQDTTEELLETLAAADGPLPGGEIAGHLDLSSEQYNAAVQEASSYSLVEEHNGFLRVHALVRDFYLRALRRRGDFRDRIADLANRSQSAFLATETGARVRVDALLATFRLLSWSGRLNEALELHRTAFGTLLQTAIELYDERRYEDALHYFEAVIESTEDDRRARLYLARTLAHLRRTDEARSVMSELLAREPQDVELLRMAGRVEFILRKWERALEYYEHARELRPRWLPVLRDLGQVNIRLERWEAAREDLRLAMSLAEPGIYVQLYYSQVLEHFGELDDARAAAESATRGDPDNPASHHRLGRVLLAQEEYHGARRAFERALELNPTFHEAAVSLMGLLLEENELAAARRLLGKIEMMPAVRPALLAAVRAQVSLAEGNGDAAERFVGEALAEEREPETVALAVRIAVTRFDRSEISVEVAKARIEPLLRELGAKGHAAEERRWRARFVEKLVRNSGESPPAKSIA